MPAAQSSDSVPLDRSPRGVPRITLKAAVDAVGKLFQGARRAVVSREAAVKVLGYKSLSGPAGGALAALSGYGLISKKGASGIAVSDLAISILHPVSAEQGAKDLVRAALYPQIFADLAASHLECALEVIASTLVQNGFSPDAGNHAATIFKKNAIFANLSSHLVEEGQGESAAVGADGTENDAGRIESDARSLGKDASSHNHKVSPSGSLEELEAAAGRILAVYKVPLGSNEAQITFTGERLEPDDFDALIEYVAIFKKQFVRQQRTQLPEQ